MANICSTTIYVSGDEENIDKLFSFLEDLDVNNTKYVSSKDIFDFMETPENEIDDYRSAVVFFDREDKAIDMDSAWSEPRVLINKMAEHFGVEMTWYAEEPGCGYYVTNDHDFSIRSEYMAVLAGDEVFCNNENEVIDAINKYLDENYKDVPKINTLEDLKKEDYYDLEINYFQYGLIDG